MNNFAVKRLYFVRHGQVVPEMQGVYYGWLDPGLSDLGIEQSRRLGDWMRRWELEFDRIYCSDLLRARLTLEYMQYDREDVILSADLREKWLGDDEGKSFDEIIATYPDIFKRSGRGWLDIASGETLEEFMQRIDRALERIRAEAEPGNTLIVCHGGVIRALAARILGAGAAGYVNMRLENGSLSLIEDYGDALILRSFNEHHFLESRA